MERNRSVIVCLSGGLNEKDQPSEKMKARLDKIWELFTLDTYEAIITTSRGTYRDPHSHKTTEAEAGRLYLTQKGIDPARILIEDQSMDTLGNLFFATVRYLELNRWLNPTIITNEFHMPRARFLSQVVLDERYTPDFVAVPNLGMSDEELERWQRHQEVMLSFYQGVFAGVKRGDMAFLADYIYHRNPAYTKVVDHEYQELTARVEAIWSKQTIP